MQSSESPKRIRSIFDDDDDDGGGDEILSVNKDVKTSVQVHFIVLIKALELVINIETS